MSGAEPPAVSTIPKIHPTAIVAPGAEIGSGVEIGPFAVIGPRVRLGSLTVVGPHVVIDGNTDIGAENRIFQFASVGAEPQDLKYHGEPSRLVIGDRNRIREFATLQPGTEGGGMETQVGHDNLIMAYSHVAHDCTVGSHVVLANGVQLGGHVTIDDYAILGALSGVHQFVRVGESAIVGAGSMVSQDVPPYCNATGDRARLIGLNTIGVRRRGLEAAIPALKGAYRVLFRSGLTVADAVARARADFPNVAEVERIAAFVERSERGVCR
jgi:UDP-N-acetylglucosamine acyltransferase